MIVGLCFPTIGVGNSFLAKKGAYVFANAVLDCNGESTVAWDIERRAWLYFEVLISFIDYYRAIPRDNFH